MGKYKQWLHHQEIGRRLRDQINTLEMERARVQKMAPTHPTTLPDLDNPLIAALLNYTRAGNKLSNIDVIKAAMPKLDPDQRRPAGSAATSAAAPAAVAPASAVTAPRGATTPVGDAAVVASLLARAEHMPTDPLDQMRALAHTGDTQKPSPSAAAPSTYEAPQSESVGGWWQRQRADEQD